MSLREKLRYVEKLTTQVTRKKTLDDEDDDWDL
mgnify:CR=1 FL=1